MVSSWIARARAALAHAFAIEPTGGPLAPDDDALLDAIAAAVVRRGLVTPAVLWLESMKPVSFLGAQALYAVRPLAQVVVEPSAVERAARLLERRDGVERLIERILRAEAAGAAAGPAPTSSSPASEAPA